ncbi:UDP-4-amino-4,6-dideoxy-N-acetyl-beta-L-altrosamine N-acetyltransferase [Paenibacillus sp. FSL H8-0034]|uniref:UDP-4-amino-4, 6-dideoxy-N-acetyl-beta-L-altrosamine N-acetyltransferase n=1 Tax=Paenibacillus sp. FSL H8-0034 TaxID=2954671 RepID=UPI0030F60853
MTVGASSCVRPIEMEDLPIVLEWRNAERIRQWMYTDHIITWEEHLQWFTRLQTASDRKTLVYTSEGRSVGIVNFTQIVPEHRRCTWGFYLGPEGLPPGTGYIMGSLALQYAFAQYPIDKINAEVFDSNEVSIRFHLKLGFAQEGLFHSHIFKGEQWHDIRCFALFRDQFEERNLK